MKTIAVSIVKNEQDIIEPFVRHTLSYVDRLYILDHRSGDQTLSILRAIQAEGLPLQVFRYADSGRSEEAYIHIQQELMTHLFRHAMKKELDAVYFFLDADEFLDHPDGRIGLQKDLENLRHLDVEYIPWRTHVIPPDAEQSYFFDIPRTFKFRRITELPVVYKAIVKADHSATRLGVSFGNHKVLMHCNLSTSLIRRFLRKVRYDVIEGQHRTRISLRHYPVRNPDQIFQKSILGWLATLRKYPLARVHGECVQWSAIYDQIDGVETISIQTLSELSMSYAQDAPQAATEILEDCPNYTYSRTLQLVRGKAMRTVLEELENQATIQGIIRRSRLSRLISWMRGLFSVRGKPVLFEAVHQPYQDE